MGILSHKITRTHMDIIAVWDCLFSTVIAGKYLFGEFMHFYALWNIVLSLSTVLQNTKLLLNSSTDVKSQWGTAHWIYKSCHCIFLAQMSLPESWTGLHYCLHCYFSVQNFSGEIWLEQFTTCTLDFCLTGLFLLRFGHVSDREHFGIAGPGFYRPDIINNSIKALNGLLGSN